MTESQQEIANDLVDAFEMFDSWDDRYSFLIDLGRKLPPMPGDDKNEATRVHGCQSSVWLVARPCDIDAEATGKDRIIDFLADSDASIVKGLIAILMRIYSGQTASAILSFDIDGLIERLQLQQHLSMNRGNGLQAMIKRIKLLAAEVAASRHDAAIQTGTPMPERLRGL